MTNPLDSTDLANLVQADWHEEFGDIDYANEIRESVHQPSLNNWDWMSEADISDVGSFVDDMTIGYIIGVGVGSKDIGFVEDGVGGGTKWLIP